MTHFTFTHAGDSHRFPFPHTALSLSVTLISFVSISLSLSWSLTAHFIRGCRRRGFTLSPWILAYQSQIKRHLAGVKGDVASCRSVPYDVRFQMGENLKEIGKTKQQAKEDQENSNISPLEETQEYEVVQEIYASGWNLGRGNSIGPSRVSSKSNLGKRKVVGEMDKYFAPRTTLGAQLGIKSVLATKEAKKRVDMAIARFIYDACIPLNAVNSNYYQPMLNVIASIGPGYRGLNYHALRVPLLKEAKREVQMIVDSYRTYWAELGCTIMADGWTDNRQKNID
uniref:DUF659 domain-containing protein n=1 Tax=Fagus sylvatica TaxID=28930 RepID=A0A2N9FB09_FAGSY